MDGKPYHSVFYGGTDIPEYGHVYYGIQVGDPLFALIGDSYARQYANFLNKSAVPFVAVFSDGQIQFKGVHVFPVFKKLSAKEYQLFFENYNNILLNIKTKDVIFAHNWNLYLSNESMGTSRFSPYPMNQSVRREAIAKGIIDLADTYSDKIFYLIGQPVSDPLVEMHENCVLLKHNQNIFVKIIINNLECSLFAESDFTTPIKVNEFLSNICKQRENLHFIDPNPALCNDKLCRVITDDNHLVFSDGTHLSLFGAEIVGTYILQQLKLNQE